MKVVKILIIFVIFFMSGAMCCFGAVNKWNRPQYIKTYVPSNHKYTKLMKEAFSRWTKASNGKIIFYYVNTPKIAQINVHFVETIFEADNSIGMEERRISRRGNRLRSNIYIAEQTYNNKNLKKNTVFTVMLHEIGRSIGMPFSSNKLSIMHPIPNEKQEILASDVNKLNILYQFK